MPIYTPIDKTSISDELKLSDEVIVHRSYTEYPTMPINFSLSPDVETMYFRYKMYQQNHEPLTGMANFCLSLLEASAKEVSAKKDRWRASKKYRIDFKVLNSLGKLCANKGGEKEARKAKGTSTPLTGEERIWIEAVIKSVIKRVGEWTCNPDTDFKELTFADFPDLKP